MANRHTVEGQHGTRLPRRADPLTSASGQGTRQTRVQRDMATRQLEARQSRLRNTWAGTPGKHASADTLPKPDNLVLLERLRHLIDSGVLLCHGSDRSDPGWPVQGFDMLPGCDAGEVAALAMDMQAADQRDAALLLHLACVMNASSADRACMAALNQALFLIQLLNIPHHLQNSMLYRLCVQCHALQAEAPDAAPKRLRKIAASLRQMLGITDEELLGKVSAVRLEIEARRTASPAVVGGWHAWTHRTPRSARAGRQKARAQDFYCCPFDLDKIKQRCVGRQHASGEDSLLEQAFLRLIDDGHLGFSTVGDQDGEQAFCGFELKPDCDMEEVDDIATALAESGPAGVALLLWVAWAMAARSAGDRFVTVVCLVLELAANIQSPPSSLWGRLRQLCVHCRALDELSRTVSLGRLRIATEGLRDLLGLDEALLADACLQRAIELGFKTGTLDSARESEMVRLSELEVRAQASAGSRLREPGLGKLGADPGAGRRLPARACDGGRFRHAVEASACQSLFQIRSGAARGGIRCPRLRSGT